MTNWEELQWRGLVKDVAGDDIADKINNESVTFYWGTDPTADSLHIGHYSSLVTAKRLMKMGHKPILLCGGATGRIGDPRPTAEREIISIEKLNKNIEGIRAQIDRLFDGKAKLVNNYDWFQGYEYLDFLRDVGKYINVNYMLSKDIINRRLDTGITYAEFSYMLIQGYDFLNMYRNMNCIMQVEGSDQWGNITTGIDLIRKIEGKEAYAFTMPLILDANGNKFGKSEGNALWLDINKTSSYELYQYLINTDDSMIEHYLKVFTFLTPEEIIDVIDRHNKEPHLRIGQKTLAKCIITDIHGEDEYNKAEQISKALFSGDLTGLSAKDILVGMKMVPSIKLSGEIKLLDLLVDNGICSSRREAREMLSSNAISLNNEKFTDENAIIDKSLAIEEKVIVIRKGKKKQFIGIFD
ncbi:MAG TPA: tyrosine--tRNA ligase [Candidatus Coprovivens excrementavium]|nr:tyrosine--tRNA ligase [Candidatus Coprovivens excrementavium]